MNETDRRMLRHHTLESLGEWWNTLDEICGQTECDTWDAEGLATFLDVSACGFSDVAGTLRRERIVPGLDLAAVIFHSAAEGLRKLESVRPGRDVGPLPLGPETTRALLSWEWEGITSRGGGLGELERRLRNLGRRNPGVTLDTRALRHFLAGVAGEAALTAEAG
jgi:hypothetical protein